MLVIGVSERRAAKSAISQDLLDHLRYPQDFFKVQRQILARYHMTNPDNWYQRSSLWTCRTTRWPAPSTQTKEPPFYLSVKWPGDDNPIFSRPAPMSRTSARTSPPWRVNADASSPEYGRMRILQMSDTTQIDGRDSRSTP